MARLEHQTRTVGQTDGPLEVLIRRNGVAVDFTVATSLQFLMWHAEDQTNKQNSATVTGTILGKMQYQLLDADTDTAGQYVTQFIAVMPGGTVIKSERVYLRFDPEPPT